MRLIPQRRRRISFGSAFALLIGLLFAAGHAYAASVPKMAAPTLTGGERQISLTWSYPQGVTGLQAYRIRYREKGRSAWNYADAKADDGEQNFEGHITSATIPAHETFTMKDSTTYQVGIRAGKWDGDYDGWGEWSNTAEATTAAVTLAASAVTLTGATLTIGNYTGNWHYKYTRPTGGRCSSAVSTASTTVGGLTANTSYTFKAYSDGNCSSVLAAASAFPTLPPKASTPTVTAVPSGGALHVRATVSGDSTLRWEYKKKDDTWDADWTAVDQAWTQLTHTVGDLTDGTGYQFKVRAVNASGTGAESDPSGPVSPSTMTVTVSKVEAASATLTLAWPGQAVPEIYAYKSHTAPHNTCQTQGTRGKTSFSFDKLTPNANYTYTFYDTSTCIVAHKVVTAPKFRTKPGKPKDFTVAAGAGSGKLTLTATMEGNANPALTKWQYKRKVGAGNFDSDWTDLSVTTATLSHTFTGLTNDTDYQFKVRAQNVSGYGAESKVSTAAQPKDETLSASKVEATTATLTIGNYTPSWYYKYTSPTGGACSTKAVSGASVDLSDLTPGTSYTFNAYSDSGCSTELAAASAFLTKPAKTTGVTIKTLNGKLGVSWSEVTSATGYKVQWKSGNQNYHKDRRTTVNSGTKHTIPSLTNDTKYTLQVAAVNGTGDGAWSDAATGTPATETLTASEITRTSAKLTLANYAGDWSYKSTAAHSPCNAIADGTTEVSLTELTAGTEYTYAAFGSSTCGPTSAEIGRETFTTPEAATLAASNVEADSATLTIGNHTAAWWYKRTAPTGDSTCHSVPANDDNDDLSNLDSGTSHTYKAYSDSSCSKELASETLLTLPGKTAGVSLDPGSEEIGVSWTAVTGAASYKVQWKSGSEKYDSSRQATPTSASHTITGLTNDTEYTLRVAAVNNTGDGAWSDEAGATPKAVTLTATNVAQTTATLKIAGYTKAWAFSRTDNLTCTAVAAGTSEKNVTGLTKNTEYTYHAFSGAQCVTSLQIAEHTFTTLDSVTLTASLTGADTATLTIANYAPNWYYKADAAPDNTCQGPVSGTTRNLKSLAGNTNYTYKAYRDSSCSTTALASASAFLTRPGKPGNFTVSNGVGSGKLTLSALVTGDGPGGGTTGEVSWWEYVKKEGSGNFETPWTEIQSTSNTLSHTVTGLTDDTDYQFKVRAVNATGTGPSSDASDAAAPVDGIPSFGNNTIADQTYVKDQPIETLTLPAASGGDAPLTYALTPALPNGLTFDALTRMISGTPTGLQAETTYTYTVTDDDDTVTDDDDDTATLNFKLTVIASASVETPRGGGGGGSANRKPAFGAQTIPDQTWLQGLVFEPLVLPEASGGDGTLTYTLEPALPEGVTFDTATRVLSGLPETPLAPTRYTYKATDRDGDAASLTFTLTVLASGAQDRRPAFSEDQRVVGNGKLAGHVPPDAQGAGATTADLNYAQNTAIEPTVLPAAEAGDGTLSYTLEPALPQGMTFDADTRVLSGTPATQAAPTLYTYTATDEDGDRATLVFTLAVAADLQPAFGPGATLPDLSYEQRAVIEPLTLPAATGGDGVLSYALQPALPQGLSFDATTRVLSGTPATRMKAARYTYTVTDADGDTASLYFRLAATPSARARAEQSVLTDGLASQGRAVLGGARRALDGRFRDADQAVDLSVLRANWSSWQERLSAAAKGSSGNNPGATGGGLDLANAWGQTSSMPPHEVSGGLSPETPGSAGDASLTPLPGVFGLSGLAGTCGTAALDETPWPNASDSRVDNGWDDGACNGAASIRLSDWLWGRRYALRLNGIFGNADDDARAGPDWTLWSAGDQRRIEGTPGNNRYETDWRSMHLGLDARFNSDWLAGVVVSRGWGETGYGYEAQGVSGTGELDTDVWTALPYLHGRLGGFEVWGLAGGGWGEIKATRSEGDGIKEDSNLNLWLGAVGASRPLLGIGPLSLSFVADAGLTHMTTDKGDGNSALDGLEATTQQVRLGLAGEYEASLFDGQAELTPFWQLSGRYDGGDGLAGAGLEAQAGLRYRSERLSLVAQGHWLGMHSETGYKEYGASMEARVSPLAHGRGLTLALSPRWGADGALSGAASGMGTANSATGIGALWDTDIVRRAAIANTQAAGDDTAHVWSVDAEVGYGLWLPYQLGLLTPFSEMRLAGGHEQRQRLGLRLDAGGAQTPGGLQLELTGFRASTHLETDTGVNLNATLNY